MAVSRVIEVSFGRSSVALVRIDTAYFYNNGIIFKPTDIDLPASYQVHWADSPQASSTLETIGTAEGAPIPDDLWNRSRVIYGWIYLHPTNDSGVTGYEVRIYKNVRAGLPDGTEPTPEEQSLIDQAIGALNTAVAKTAQDVISADQSARSAQGYAEQAETAKDTAQTYANNAQTSATQASTSASQASQSATASAQSASQSAQIKADVESLADDAQGYADSASQSASQASASEQGCARAVLDAASAAAIARARADEASGYAQTASTKAQNASQSASTASQKATEASQSATNASQSAQTAEQAKTASQTAQGLAESARDNAVSAKTDAESARDDAETARDEAQSAVASISGALDEKAPIITDTASGSIASFSDGADDLPLKSLVIDINPVQDLSHGDPSPENICPISGWTEVNVNHSDADMTNPTTLTIQLGQTVYGGKLDVLSGKLVIDMYFVDPSQWTRYNASNGYIAYRILGIPNGRYGNDAMNKPLSNIIAEFGGFSSSAMSKNIIQPPRINADTAYLALQNGIDPTTVELSYLIANPLTVQLSANQLNSLYGQNNLWADSGDTEVEYRADTKLFIERLTAPDSADMIADANITSGQYFMVGNSLFKATANIANGAQIIVGTNAVRKSLSEALNEINA